MRKYSLIGCLFLIIFSCQKTTSPILVSNVIELENAIKAAKAGDDIVLKNGIYKDVEIQFVGEGTKDHPISLRAETPGEVFIEGFSTTLFIIKLYLSIFFLML